MRSGRSFAYLDFAFHIILNERRVVSKPPRTIDEDTYWMDLGDFVRLHLLACVIAVADIFERIRGIHAVLLFQHFLATWVLHDES